ncbi:uncharacterized protein LOC131858608 [Cryptomeria japonica]|uniref:uncharacterized protein LOC131858608 n=1 Tax=Cryptomeria japonica TaxID=3369 RepID=UPI0027DA7FF4|nr:uncharacterized protein LOC131858608 [Cryptomeria japonica]
MVVIEEAGSIKEEADGNLLDLEKKVDVLNEQVQEIASRANVAEKRLQEVTRFTLNVMHSSVTTLCLLQENTQKGCEFLRVRNLHGNIALHLAALYDHLKLVEKFVEVMQGDVEAGNFVRFENLQGNTTLYEATKEGNYKTVKVLLNHDAGLRSVSNCEAKMALSIASQRGHIRFVEALLCCTTPINNMEPGHHDDLTSVSNREGEEITSSQSGHTKRLLLLMHSNTTSKHHFMLWCSVDM